MFRKTSQSTRQPLRQFFKRPQVMERLPLLVALPNALYSLTISTAPPIMTVLTCGTAVGLSVWCTVARKPMHRRAFTRALDDDDLVRVAHAMHADTVAVHDALHAAFDTVFAIGDVRATRQLYSALRDVLQSTTNPTLPQTTPTLPQTTPTQLVQTLVAGALHRSVQQHDSKCGLLDKPMRRYVVANHPDWVVENPDAFDMVELDKHHPGWRVMLESVLSVYDSVEERREAIRIWQQKSVAPATDLPTSLADLSR